MPPETPICPRCGYDLVGVVAAWSDCCPLDGTCSECGHLIDWGFVHGPEARDLPWLVEHAQAPPDFVVRSVLTLRQAVRPFKFWRAIGLDRRISVSLLLWWLASVVLVVQVVQGVALQLIFGGGIRDGWGEWIAGAVGFAMSPFALVEISIRGGLDVFVTSHDATPTWLLIITLALGWPAALLALPITRERAKLRFGHIARGAIIAAGVVHVAYAPLLIASECSMRGLLWSMPSAVQGLVRLGAMALGLTIFFWLAGWWKAAAVCGWRVERPRTVWTLLEIIAILAALVVFVLASQWIHTIY